MPNDEAFDFQCPKCGKRLKAGAAHVGRRVKCPKCLQPLTVPAERPAPATPAAAAGAAGPAAAPSGSDSTTATDKKTAAPAESSDVPALGPVLASVPVASLEDDWLNLGGPAIADLSARQQAVEENKAAKERERTQRKNKEQLRQQSTAPVSAASPEAASQRRLATIRLDDDLPELAPLPGRGAANSGTASGSGADRDAGAKRSIFDDDLPELADLQPGAKPNSSADKLLAAHAGVDPRELDNLSALVPDLGAAPPRQNRPPGRSPSGRPAPGAGREQGAPALFEPLEHLPPEAEEKDPEYRIECKSCGTAQYVRRSNQGMKIKCPDCYANFRVPPPPTGVAKKAKLQLTGEDIPLSAAEELHHLQTLESQRSRATQLLQRAQQQASEEDLDRLYDGDFDTAGFVQRTFGFFKDPVAMAHVIGYGIVFACLFALGQFTANNLESRMGRGVLLLTVIGAPVVAILFAMPMLSGGIALLESVANRQKRVADWPGFNLFDNAGDIAAISIALLGALLPGYFIGSWLGGEGEGAGRIQIAGMMVTTFALFPVFLLSMLDNGSVFAPLSSSIFRSFSEAAEDWGAYYLKTLIAFSFVMLLWFLLLGKHEALAAAAGCLLPLLVFFTCQQIGALADAISDHLSFEWAPPEEDQARDGEKAVDAENGASDRKQQALRP